MEAKAAKEIAFAHLTALERKYMDDGMTREQAEERACNEVRREIRNGPLIRLF